MRGVTILVAAAALTILGGASARPTPWAACGVVCGDFLPSWSPDGRTVAFVHYVHGSSGPRETIYAVPASGGREHAIIGLAALREGGLGGPFRAISWSPDSTLVDVSAGGANWIVPAGGGAAHLVVGFDASWSPDSTQLAVGTAKDIGGFRSPQFVPARVQVAAVDGSGPRVLAGSDPATPGGEWASNPVWSAQNEIAYVTGDRQSGTQLPDESTAEIWVVRPDGTGARRLVGQGALGYRPLAWSADGQRLLFLASKQYGSFVYGVDRTGGTPTLLDDFVQGDSCCTVTPDGNRLAVWTQGLDRGADLQVVDLTTGSARTVLHSAGYGTAASMSWSPAGDRLALARGGECGPLFGIETIPADGGPATRLTNRCRRDGTARADGMRGGIGPDALYGHGGNDVLDGGGGPDFLQGGRGDDVIHGGPGNDRIYGGSGHDVLRGDAGNDTIWARDRDRDVVHCGTGRDTVYADRLDAVAPDCEVLYRG
ncbi:MAG TPA: hypothetical protein VFU10_10590 [Gaiellaceae bacterium]|nr:hypothetical protein [Gaiellaceae bacterium]